MKFPRSPTNISRGDSAREIPPWLRQVNARRRARGQCRSGGRSVASRETPSACWERTRQREARGSAPPGGKASRGRRTRKDRCLASLERAFRISGELSRDRAEGKVAVAGAGRLAADERDKSTGDASREVEGAVGALGSASDADSSARDMGGQDAPRAWTHVKDGRDATNAARSVAHAAAASARPAWGASGPVATLVNELIDALRPTEQSDRRRRAVFQHIASLVDGCFAGENVLVRVPHAARRRQTRRARRATAIPVRSRTARCLAILGSLVFSRRLARSRTPDLRRAARSPFDRHLPRGGSSAAAASIRWPGRSQRAEKFLRVVWKSETTLNQTTESTGRRPDPSG